MNDTQSEAGGHTAGLKMFGEPITADSFEGRAIAAGHVLMLEDEDGCRPGEVDGFAFSIGNCNGPACSICDWAGCHHCNGDIPACDGGQKRREREAAERIRDAAPDLLEALKGLKAAFGDPMTRRALGGHNERQQIAILAASAAIARAHPLSQPGEG